MGQFDDRMIYAYWPASYGSPEEAIACYHPDRTEDPAKLKPTGWMLDESMVGTVWVNLHTGTDCTIHSVGVRMGDLDMYESDPHGLSMGLGCWRTVAGHETPCFIAEHWARVDHLGPEMRLHWFAVEIARHREDIERHEQSAAFYANNPGYPKSYVTNDLDQAERAREHLDSALKAARAYALKNGLIVPSYILNAGLSAGAQMALF